ncbi:MAG: hypothetical protein M3Y85_12720 [Bacteroidota bacterium]|nr:hypothetical protein [Bacteroidota bacterium]
MKRWLIGIFILPFIVVKAQPHTTSFSSIDWEVQNIDAPTPDSLARLLISNYTTETEKVRAIYSWITGHIAYNTAVYKYRSVAFKYVPDPIDTASTWPSGDEMTARRVMRRKIAVCDGYSRLFKILCDHAGIEAAIIQGYGRVYEMGNKKFRTNHTWNAVKIDSVWKLLDVTWASGYIDYADDFIQKQNDFYFLTPPDQFIRDHYPEELRWTLLSHPPALSDFKKMPFHSKNFIKYGIASYFPSSGIIEALVGDTLNFSLQLNDIKRAKSTGADPFADTTSFTLWPLSSFVKPVTEKAAVVYYTYVVQPSVEWVHLLYNDDVVLQYRLKPKIELTSK